MRRLSGRATVGEIGLLIGIAILVVVVGIDIALSNESAAIVGTFVMAPLVTALIAGPAATFAVAVAASACALANPLWNPMTEDAEQLVRILVVSLGGAFGVAGSWYRARSASRSERLALLDAVGEVADGSLSLGDTLHRVTEVIAPAFADICLVDVIRDGRATRIAARSHGGFDDDEIQRRLYERKPSLPQWLLAAEPSWRHLTRWWPRMGDEDLRRLAQSPADLEFLRALGVRSSITAPIRARDRNLGALTLISAWSRRRYDRNDVRFAEILASRIALALDNTGLFSDLESIERRMDSVMEIIDEAVVIHGREGELVYANPAAARLLGFATTEEAVATPMAALRERFRIRDEAGRELGPEALAGGRALAGEDSEPVTLRVTSPGVDEERWYRTRARPVRGSDQRVLYSVTVIEDVSDVKRAEFSQRLLGRTGELISSSADYRQTLEDVAKLLVPEFADWCAVNTIDNDGTVQVVATAHRDPERAKLVRAIRERYTLRLDSPGPLPAALRDRQPLLRQLDEQGLREIASNDEHLRLLRELDAASTVFVPMVTAGRLVGALNFVNDSSSRRFDAADLEIASEVARRAGVAIENARIADERTRVAEVLQRELLPPSLPRVQGWEVETMYEPAGELNDVGGDFYEVFRVPGGWAIVLGDVSGHGAVAASLTAEARHTIRSAGQVAADPCAGLHLLNRNLRTREDAALCSAALLVLADSETPECEATIYLAGHPHPLLVRGSAAVPVGTPGPALGVIGSPVWEAASLTVRPGDQLILYTDGVIEARLDRSSDRFGTERLRSHVAGSARPEETIARVRSALEGFRSRFPDDDAALVAICRTAGPLSEQAERVGAGVAAVETPAPG